MSNFPDFESWDRWRRWQSRRKDVATPLIEMWPLSAMIMDARHRCVSCGGRMTVWIWNRKPIFECNQKRCGATLGPERPLVAAHRCGR